MAIFIPSILSLALGYYLGSSSKSSTTDSVQEIDNNDLLLRQNLVQEIKDTAPCFPFKNIIAQKEQEIIFTDFDKLLKDIERKHSLKKITSNSKYEDDHYTELKNLLDKRRKHVKDD